MRKSCPKCKTLYTELDQYCAKCGEKLEMEPNRCSANRTALCATKICGENDLFCTYCGAPTTYALAKRDGHW